MLRAYSLSERRQFDVLLGYPHLVQFLLILQNKLFYQGLSLWREFSFHDFTRFDQERGIKILRDCMNVRWIMLYMTMMIPKKRLIVGMLTPPLLFAISL
jgi:hypothetical protein